MLSRVVIMRKGANSEKTSKDLEDTKTGQNEALTGTVSPSLNGELNGSVNDQFNEESGSFGVNLDDPTELPKDPTKVAKKGKRKDTVVGSWNITNDAEKGLKLLQRRTGKSKKEIVSGAILNALKVNIDAPIIKFNLPSPNELMLYRAEVVSLEAESTRLCDALKNLRPTSKEQAQRAAEVLSGLDNHLIFLENVSRKLGKKERLLENLSEEDYHNLGKVFPWLDEQRDLLKGRPNSKRRLARIALLEWFLTLIISIDDVVPIPKEILGGKI